MSNTNMLVCLGVKTKSEINAVVADEAQWILSKILGGSDYVRSNIYSQYHYYLGQYDRYKGNILWNNLPVYFRTDFMDIWTALWLFLHVSFFF